MSRVRVLVVVTLVTLFFLIAVPAAQAGFATHVDYTAGSYNVGLAMADFNRDGRQDVAVADGSHGVAVLLGNGSGGFGTATPYGLDGSPSAIVTGDFNGDAKPDIAVACESDMIVCVLLGNGSGGFGTVTDYGPFLAPAALTAADFSRDGKTDLAVVDRDYNQVVVMIATSTGFPTRTDYGVGESPLAVAAGDFNGDAKLDLAVTESADDSILLLTGNGSGGFTTGSRCTTDSYPQGLTVADLTGDDKNDVAVVTDGESPVQFLTGDGAGHLTAAGSSALAGQPDALAAVDLDSDGNTDLAATGGYTSSCVPVLLGNGAGGFRSGGSYATGDYPVGLSAADLNADGHADIVTANSEGTVSVLLGDGSFASATMAVVPGAYDSIQEILAAMGKNYDLISTSNLTAEGLAPYTALFINCGTSSCTPEMAAAITAWVEAGGCLYASDWSYDYVATAFPGKVLFADDPKIGDAPSMVSARILDPGLAWYLDSTAPPSTIDLDFNLGSWVVPSGVGAGTTVYLQGTVPTYSGLQADTPLLAGFTAGMGRVFYTAFHNEAQVSATEQKLLEYLVLMPEAGSLANALRQTVLTAHPGWMANFEGYYAIDNGETTPKFNATPMAGQALTIGANWAGARLRLEVFRPNGSLYTSQEADTGPVIVDIPAATISASPGTWTYRLVGVTVPDTNHAVVVASFTPPDTIAPTTTPTGGGSAWYLGPVTVTLSGVDNAGGQGVAYSEYSLDGGATWVRGTAAAFPVWKRGGGNGVFTLQFRSADKAGNVETPKGVTVKIDNLDPVTRNDAPLAPRTTDTTVHLAPSDAVSGVKETWYSLDGFTAVKGTSVLITAAGHVGRHWIRYWAIDNAGNVEMSRWCSVDIAAARIAPVARGPHHGVAIRRS